MLVAFLNLVNGADRISEDKISATVLLKSYYTSYYSKIANLQLSRCLHIVFNKNYFKLNLSYLLRYFIMRQPFCIVFVM